MCSLVEKRGHVLLPFLFLGTDECLLLIQLLVWLFVGCGLLLFFTPTGCGYLLPGRSPNTLSLWHGVHSWESLEASLLSMFSDLGGLVPAQTLSKLTGSSLGQDTSHVR